MSEQKEWKVGDTCYHPDADCIARGHIPVPCKIVSRCNENPSVLLLRSLEGKDYSYNTDIPDLNTLEECSEEEFSTYASELIARHAQTVNWNETKLQEVKEARLKKLAVLQELGIKVP